MSANARPGAPSSEEVLFRIVGAVTTFEVRLARWSDGYTGLTFASRRSPSPIWRYITRPTAEVRKIAEALVRAADREGWK